MMNKILFSVQFFLFYHFIDDCVFKDVSAVDSFIECYTIHPSIKFTFEGSRDNINFLDTMVFRTEHHTLAVKPFVKPMDKNTYLHFGSFHPRHLKVNIPFGQFLRICSEYFDFHIQRLQRQFVARGHPTGVMNTAANRVAARARSTLFETTLRDRE